MKEVDISIGMQKAVIHPNSNIIDFDELKEKIIGTGKTPGKMIISAMGKFYKYKNGKIGKSEFPVLANEKLDNDNGLQEKEVGLVAEVVMGKDNVIFFKIKDISK